MADPPKKSKQPYLNEDGTLKLEFWEYKDTPLQSPRPGVGIDQLCDSLELTTYLIDQLRCSEFSSVRSILERTHKIERCVELELVRDSDGYYIRCGLELQNEHQATATAAYIMLPSEDYDACKNCLDDERQGPFLHCESFGRDVLDGACACCYYWSRASNCNPHVSQRRYLYARSDSGGRSIFNADEYWRLRLALKDSKIATGAPTDYMATWKMLLTTPARADS
ncbi:hypothetical protein F4861DRAFT_134983 [Xylaria intraflava]|nr:hypothetical protein F4861DRAFT_134983 [Xylaria intraflava]